MKTKISAYCPECHASIGTHHKDGCDVAQCLNCGGQRLSCGCSNPGKDTWDGYWPGTKEAEEYGFFCKSNCVFSDPGGVIINRTSCRVDDPDAVVDITTLHFNCVWDKDKKRFVKPA